MLFQAHPSFIHEMEMTWKWLAAGRTCTPKWLAARKVLFASLLADAAGLLLSHCHLVGSSDRRSQHVLSKEGYPYRAEAGATKYRYQKCHCLQRLLLLDWSSLSAPPYQREQMEYVVVLPLTGRQKKTSQAEEYLLGTPKNNVKLGRHMGKWIPKPGSFFHSSVCCGYLFPLIFSVKTEK